MASGPPSSHKPRRKIKKTAEFDGRVAKAEALIRTPSFPLAALLWPARGSLSQWEVLPLILMVVGLFRWAAGLWGYSGFHKPPMFGDYEAQRHWMEITTQLPISQWYFHDLEWWGLDYPPLTAYHSWILGKIGSLIDPSWFTLYTSRGSEDPTLKIFMRATVLVSEYLTYIPAAVIFVRRFCKLFGVAQWTASVALVAILMQPGTILIDHVHFQYNTVMLGFVLASMSSTVAGRYMWAAIFFVAALGFKQMALYYAPAVFAYLLGSCIFPRVNLGRLFSIAAVTAASFAVLILPLVLAALLQRASLIATLASITPPCMIIFLRPRKELLPYAFAATAWGFFLLSYQVHEKSVLLPLMPMTVLLAGKEGLGKDIRSWVGFANILGTWTMFPLLQRVELRVPYAVLTLLWAYLLGLPPTSTSAYFEETQSICVQWGTVILHGAFYLVMGTWHVLESSVIPPADKPDLWVVANVGVGAAGFSICYLWCLAKLVEMSGIMPKRLPWAKKEKVKTR
ncbi:hypothetical protein DL767_004179 [Monosporascus sp. MG133]|nr:hypothetical protein DL767_004179 [Monosporascus sp. MG133]